MLLKAASGLLGFLLLSLAIEPNNVEELHYYAKTQLEVFATRKHKNLHLVFTENKRGMWKPFVS